MSDGKENKAARGARSLDESSRHRIAKAFKEQDVGRDDFKNDETNGWRPS
jgi:hypothetical protein